MSKGEVGGNEPRAAEARDRRQHFQQLIREGCSRTVAIERAMRELRITQPVAERVYREASSELARAYEQDQAVARPLTIERLKGDLVRLRQGEIVYDGTGAPVMVQAIDPLTGKLRKGPFGRPKKEPLRKRDARAIARLEALLADVEGTNAPIRVKVEEEVTIRRSLLKTIENLTPEKIEELVIEQADLEHRASTAHRSTDPGQGPGRGGRPEGGA